MISTETDPTGDEATNPPRMTIGRGMIAIALVAGGLALIRVLGTYPAFAWCLPIGAGGRAWVAARRRPRSALTGLGVAYGLALVGIVVILAAGLRLDDPVVVASASALIALSYPCVLGMGIAWLSRPRDRRGGDAALHGGWVALAISLPAPLALHGAYFWYMLSIKGLDQFR